MAYNIDDITQIPAGEHWAIIETSSVYVPGDERSRTNPGHGYPEHYETTITYRPFTNKAEFEKAVQQKLEQDQRYGGSRPRFKAIHVAGTYKPKVTIALEEV